MSEVSQFNSPISSSNDEDTSCGGGAAATAAACGGGAAATASGEAAPSCLSLFDWKEEREAKLKMISYCWRTMMSKESPRISAYVVNAIRSDSVSPHVWLAKSLEPKLEFDHLCLKEWPVLARKFYQIASVWWTRLRSNRLGPRIWVGVWVVVAAVGQTKRQQLSPGLDFVVEASEDGLHRINLYL